MSNHLAAWRLLDFAKDQSTFNDRAYLLMAMFENCADDPRQQWSRFWDSASGFWRGLAAWRIWLLCVSLIALVVLQLYVQFRFNYWNRNFFDALERREPEQLRAQVLLLLPLCGASIALAVSSVWGRMTVQRKWREWLTTHLIGYWIEDDRYARLALIEGERQSLYPRLVSSFGMAVSQCVASQRGGRENERPILYLQARWDLEGSCCRFVRKHRAFTAHVFQVLGWTASVIPALRKSPDDAEPCNRHCNPSSSALGTFIPALFSLAMLLTYSVIMGMVYGALNS